MVTASLLAPGTLGRLPLPRVEQRYPGALKILCVSRYQRQVVNQGGRCDECVHVRLRIWNVETRDNSGNGQIYWQDSTFENLEYLSVNPGPQCPTGLRIPAFATRNPSFKL